MGRTVVTESTGKGERADGRKQLNAILPKQLVFDFNAVAKREGHGKRDAIVEGLIRRFLQVTDPTCESLRVPPSNPFADQIRAVALSKRESSRLQEQVATQEALEQARQHALQIVAATSRKPPQRAARRPTRKEKVV